MPKKPLAKTEGGGPVDRPESRLTALRELQLVEAHRSGGPLAHEAIAELIGAYQRRVYSVCYRMVRNADDASDLTQDVLLKIVESLGTYNGQSKLSTWVIRVAMNCCLTHLRKQRVREHKPLDAETNRVASGRFSGGGQQGGVGGASLMAREPLPAENVEQDQLRSALLSALDSLDGQTKAILVLRDMQDLDYQQLAEVLEIPLGTVKSRLFRARAALRAAVESRGFGSEI